MTKNQFKAEALRAFMATLIEGATKLAGQLAQEGFTLAEIDAAIREAYSPSVVEQAAASICRSVEVEFLLREASDG